MSHAACFHQHIIDILNVAWGRRRRPDMITRRLMDASWVQVKSSRHVHCKAAQILEVAPLNISSKSWGRCQGRHVITAHGGGPNVIAAVEATSQAEASQAEASMVGPC